MTRFSLVAAAALSAMLAVGRPSLGSVHGTMGETVAESWLRHCLKKFDATPTADAADPYEALETLAVGALSTPIVASNVSVTPTLSADFDQNRQVDNMDLAKWSGDFGETAGSDADVDGFSTGFDFLAWQTQYGASAPSDVVADVNPEPAALAVWGGLASVVGLIYWRRNRRAR